MTCAEYSGARTSHLVGMTQPCRYLVSLVDNEIWSGRSNSQWCTDDGDIECFVWICETFHMRQVCVGLYASEAKVKVPRVCIDGMGAFVSCGIRK